MISRRKFLRNSLIASGCLAARQAFAGSIGALTAVRAGSRFHFLSGGSAVDTAILSGVTSAISTVGWGGHSVSVRPIEQRSFSQLQRTFVELRGMTAICAIDEKDAWLFDEALRDASAGILCQGTHFLKRIDDIGEVRHHFLDLPAASDIALALSQRDAHWPKQLGIALGRVALRQPLSSTAADDGEINQAVTSSAAELRLVTYVIELRGIS